MNKNILALCILLCSINILRAQDKPNIVLFFIDDWAWNGSSVQMDDEIANSYFPSLLEMPNLEKLAEGGMVFSNAYSSAPQCSPSRVALQTGQSSPRNGFTVYMNDGGSDYYDPSKSFSKFPVVPCVSDMTIDPDATTIPEALATQGYVSAHIGKWHMRGNPGDEGYIKHDGDTDNKQGNQEIPGDPKLMFSITESAVDFIEAQANSEKPFFIQLSHYGMHEGRECLATTRQKYQAKPELQEYYKSKGETSGSISYKSDPATWLGMGEDLDGRIGVVLDKLKKLGIDDNTYVIVTSDNGYRHDFYDDLLRMPQPLHAHKWWLWQGGLRVPMIVKGPDIPAASVCDENVVGYDFLPTFIEWAGGDPETELADIDGVSLVSIMRGEAAEPDFINRTLYFHYPHYRETMPHSVAVSGDKKVVHFYEKPEIPMYFNIASDIGEVLNIAEFESDGHKALFNDMMQYLDNVGARIPLYPNPEYDSLAYVSDSKTVKRILWGPFTDDRELDNDEYISSKAKLFQHLSALNKANLTTNNSGVISKWKDQSIKENDAISGIGEAYYSSQKLFESGLAGVDFGSLNTTLEILSSQKSDMVLDFNGAASGKSGFALSIAFKPEVLNDEWCYLLGNSAEVDSINSFGIRCNGSGIIEAYLGGEIIQTSNALLPNQTAVIVLNYNSASGKFDLITSLGDTLTTNIAKGDFSNENSLYLGGINSESGGYYTGIIGELKVFDLSLDNQQPYNEVDELLSNWTRPAEKKIIQHLDASVEGSVVSDNSGLVSSWKDLSENDNHGLPLGSVLYFTGLDTSKTGLPGIDFGNTVNKMELFSADKSDAFLDFTGAAAKNNGFSIFMAFKIDDFVDNQNDIIGNSTSVDDVNGFGMRYDNNGQPRVFVGGQKIVLTNKLQKNETVIFALNYNKSKRIMEFWNSSTGASASTSLAAGDFSNNNPFTVGACNGSSRFLNGMIGEVMIYNHFMEDSIFNEQCKTLADKWINGIQSEVSWKQDPFSKSKAKTNIAYTDSITETDIHLSENIIFRYSKVSGPEWLSISEQGKLTGTPTSDDIGANLFVVQAAFGTNSNVQASLLIEVDTNTDVETIYESGIATIYPNPAEDKITIKNVDKGFYMIYDIIGNILKKGDIVHSININELICGVYFISVNGQVLKFIKK